MATPNLATPIQMPSRLKPNVLYLTVHVRDNKGTLDHDSVLISKERVQGIRWKSLTDKDVVIVFNKNGSPFEVPRIEVPAGESGFSGSAICDPDPNKHYKYMVIGSDGANDPDVVVEK